MGRDPSIIARLKIMRVQKDGSADAAGDESLVFRCVVSQARSEEILCCYIVIYKLNIISGSIHRLIQALKLNYQCLMLIRLAAQAGAVEEIV